MKRIGYEFECHYSWDTKYLLYGFREKDGSLIYKGKIPASYKALLRSLGIFLFKLSAPKGFINTVDTKLLVIIPSQEEQDMGKEICKMIEEENKYNLMAKRLRSRAVLEGYKKRGRRTKNKITA